MLQVGATRIGGGGRDEAAAYTSNKNVNYAVNNLQRYMSYLESWLYKKKYK
jgi:hypothetical protein